MARLSGNDVSNHQGNIDYEIFKKNTHFVIAKATEGVGFTDGKYIRNRDEARRTGIPFGAYHFARPDRGNAAESEADYFLSIVGTPAPGELLVLDYEANWPGNVVDWCKRFLDRIGTKLNGYKALIYLNESLTNSLDWTPVVAAGHGLWLAKYAIPRSPDATYKTGKWPFAAMYQWTSEQQVPGVLGNVDGNVFYGDVVTLKKYGYVRPSDQPPAPGGTITILRSEYEAMNRKIQELSGANEQLTHKLALKDDECKQKLQAQHDEMKKKVLDLASSL